MNSKPETAATTKALMEYLKSEHSGSGIEDLQIIGPKKVTIGDYHSQLKGWPVHAEYEVRSTQDGIRFNYIGDPKVAAAYVRTEGGKATCFKPGILAAVEDQMNEDMEKMMQQINFDD